MDVENEGTRSEIQVFWHISVGDGLDRVAWWQQIVAGSAPYEKLAAAAVQLEAEGNS